MQTLAVDSIPPPFCPDDFVSALFQSLQSKDVEAVLGLLDQALSSDAPGVFPRDWLLSFRVAVSTGNWNALSDCFKEQRFISGDGSFVWVAPFSIRRQGKTFQELTGIYGRVLPLDRIHEFPAVQGIHRLQKRGEEPGIILPVESFATFGFTGSDCGEAFLVPNGWRFRGSSLGPGMNDLLQQRARFQKYGTSSIRAIFDESSANLLLDWTHRKASGFRYQNLEFQFHELGHATGFGLAEKIRNRFFLTPWYAAVEEWRSDGVGIATAIRSLAPEDAAQVIAANLCLRFGTDSQREGGMELDSDVNAGLLLFDRLFQAGAFSLTSEHRLKLNAESPIELLELSHPMTADALRLTREEIALQDLRGAWNLYGSVAVSGASRTLFNHFVRRPNSTLECKLR